MGSAQRPPAGSVPAGGRCLLPLADGAPAPRVAVVTDNAAALPSSWGRELEATGIFAQVELPVLIDGQLHAEDEQETFSSLVLALAEGRPVTTSRPSPGQLRRAYQRFEDAGFEAVVSVHLSSGLSGTVGAARIARQDIGIPVQIVDTGRAGMAQGLAVRDAVRAALEGSAREDVAAAAASAAARAETLMQVNSLETLRRGGRITATAAMFGTMFQQKPLLSFQDGHLVTVERPVTVAKARARFSTLVGHALEHVDHPAPVLCIHHVADPHGARDLGETIVDAYRPDAQLVLSELPPVLTAHVGLGTKVGVVEGPTAQPLPHGTSAPQRES